MSVKRITLWRKEVKDEVGALARALEPLARAGTDLQVCMGYRYTGDPSRAAIEVAPISGKRAAAAAQAAGLSASSISCLIVTGDNRPGLGHDIAQQLAVAGINLGFLVAQVIGRKHSAVFGFASAEDAQRAAALIKRAAVKRK